MKPIYERKGTLDIWAQWLEKVSTNLVRNVKRIVVGRQADVCLLFAIGTK